MDLHQKCGQNLTKVPPVAVIASDDSDWESISDSQESFTEFNGSHFHSYSRALQIDIENNLENDELMGLNWLMEFKVKLGFLDLDETNNVTDTSDVQNEPESSQTANSKYSYYNNIHRLALIDR